MKVPSKKMPILPLPEVVKKAPKFGITVGGGGGGGAAVSRKAPVRRKS